MNCQQFQDVLPFIIESGGNPEQETHLESCPSCAALVQDLRYIAEQAKLLLPMHDPNPRVWSSIEQSLQREGLVQEGRLSRLGHITNTSTQTKGWTILGSVIAAAAVLVLGISLTRLRPTGPEPVVSTTTTHAAQTMSDDDQQLVSQVSQQNPSLRDTYESNLREVNAYISDAEQAVRDNPADSAAQESLMDAYQQKSMLYEMATMRSLR